MSTPRPGDATPAGRLTNRPPDRDRLAAVRRLEASAVGSGGLNRLASLAARMLGTASAQVSLLGDVQTVAGGAGLARGAIGARSPLAESLCTVTAAQAPEPLVIADAPTDPRVAALPPVASGAVGSYLGMPLTGPDDTVVGALCVFDPQPRAWSDDDVGLLRELTDSAATELELAALSREYEADRLRFELAIAAAEIGSFDWDVVTGRLIWDDRLVRLFGYDRATFDETIEAFNARLHPDDVARVTAALQSAIDDCGAFESEYRVLLPTGETRWIAGRGKALPGGDGRAVRLLGAAYDTTRQRQGDARVARVLEVMNAAFFSLDRDWRFTYVNAEAERVLHHRREELLGGNIWELFPYAVGTDFEVNYRGAAADGRQRVFEAYYPPPLDGWYEVRAWPSPDGLAVYFLDISERRAADRQAAAGAARLAAVADVTATLSGTHGPGQTEDSLLEHALRAAVPVLGDWLIATLVSDDGHLRDAATWHRDPALRPAVDRYAAQRLGALHPAAPLAQALTGGRTVTLDDAPEAEGPGAEGEPAGWLSPCSAVVLPLTAHGRTLGALSVYRGAERAPMDREDLAAARQIADRAALALDNLRLHQQQARLAEMLQRSMLTAPPQPEHEEIAVRYHPAVEVADVGGDWYDAFEQADGATMLVIGDVVGHDMQAAARMGQLRGVLRGIAQRDGTGPADVLREIDAAIERLHLDAMATAAVIRLEQSPEERAAGMTRLRWSNAGHPPPLLLYPDGRTQLLAGERAELMLGVHAQTRRSETTVDVARGATLLLYTDGLVEDRDLPFDEGISRLRAALTDLAGASLDELCDQLLARLRPGALHDDVALLALRLHPQDRPRRTTTRTLPAGLPRG